MAVQMATDDEVQWRGIMNWEKRDSRLAAILVERERHKNMSELEQVKFEQISHHGRGMLIKPSTYSALFFLARSQNLETRLLVSSCLSVCPSVPIDQLVYHWTDFHEIWYLSIFRQSVKKNVAFRRNLTRITNNLHEELCTLMVKYRGVVVKALRYKQGRSRVRFPII